MTVAALSRQVPFELRSVVEPVARRVPLCVRPGCGHGSDDHSSRPTLGYGCAVYGCGCDHFAEPWSRTGPAPVVVWLRGDLREDAEGALRTALTDLLNGAATLRDLYIGAKRYDRFHQGIACRYGYGPTHGRVVLGIGLRDEVRRRLADGGSLTVEEIAASWEWLTGRPLPPFTLTFLRWQDALARLAARNRAR